MQIQLIWNDLTTHQQQQPILETPVTLGREFSMMPGVLDGQRVSRVVLDHPQVAEYHALIEERNGELVIVDRNTTTGIQINNMRLPSSTLLSGDRIQIGPYVMILKLGAEITSTTQGCDRMVGFLFKHRCGRLDPLGCPHCQGGQTEQDPYLTERSYYPNYGRYDTWGSHYYYQRDDYSYNPETRQVDFTEADAGSFNSELDQDFEQDFGAS